MMGRELMSDKPLVVELPEDLIEKVIAANIDVRAVVEQALTDELETHSPRPAMAEKEALLRRILPPERVEEAIRLIRAGKRIPDMFAGQIWVSDDFDDPLL